MEDHSGVADRTGNSVDSAVARVKGKHHDGDVLSWTVYYAVKSGGTANLFVLCGWKGFFNRKKQKRKDRTIIITKEKIIQKKNKPKLIFF